MLRNPIVHRIASKAALFLLFVPALAVLFYEAGMIAVNGGCLLALFFLGKILLKPLVQFIKAYKTALVLVMIFGVMMFLITGL